MLSLFSELLFNNFSHESVGGQSTNIDKVKFTGKKLQNKKYYKQTGHPGGIKETTPATLRNAL